MRTRTNVLIGLAGRIEGLLLLGLGGLMAWMALSAWYGLWFNPRYAWLTGLAGLGLAALGFARMIRRPAGGSWLRAGAYALFMAAACWSIWSSLPHVRAADLANASQAPVPALDESQPGPTASLNGEDYLKINLPELSFLVRRKGASATGLRVVVRGRAMRAGALEEASGDARGGGFGLARVAMTCCLADALALGFPLRLPEGLELTPGAWYRVWARVQPSLQPPANPPRLDGLFLVSLNGAMTLVVDAVEPIAQPAIPFAFEFRDQPPYAY